MTVFLTSLLVDHLIVGFQGGEFRNFRGVRFRIRSIKNMLAATGQTMRFTDHEIIELQRCFLIVSSAFFITSLLADHLLVVFEDGQFSN